MANKLAVDTTRAARERVQAAAFGGGRIDTRRNRDADQHATGDRAADRPTPATVPATTPAAGATWFGPDCAKAGAENAMAAAVVTASNVLRMNRLLLNCQIPDPKTHRRAMRSDPACGVSPPEAGTSR
jgi:hypothetical protein